MRTHFGRVNVFVFYCLLLSRTCFESEHHSLCRSVWRTIVGQSHVLSRVDRSFFSECPERGMKIESFSFIKMRVRHYIYLLSCIRLLMNYDSNIGNVCKIQRTTTLMKGVSVVRRIFEGNLGNL